MVENFFIGLRHILSSNFLYLIIIFTLKMGYFFMHPSVSDERSKSSCVRFFSPILRSRGIKATPSFLALPPLPHSSSLYTCISWIKVACYQYQISLLRALPPDTYLKSDPLRLRAKSAPRYFGLGSCFARLMISIWIYFMGPLAVNLAIFPNSSSL